MEKDFLYTTSKTTQFSIILIALNRMLSKWVGHVIFIRKTCLAIAIVAQFITIARTIKTILKRKGIVYCKLKFSFWFINRVIQTYGSSLKLPCLFKDKIKFQPALSWSHYASVSLHLHRRQILLSVGFLCGQVLRLWGALAVWHRTGPCWRRCAWFLAVCSSRCIREPGFPW